MVIIGFDNAASNLDVYDYVVYRYVMAASPTNPTIKLPYSSDYTILSSFVNSVHSKGSKAVVMLYDQDFMGTYGSPPVINVLDGLLRSGQRSTLISNIATFLNTYGFDGVFIDWERDPRYLPSDHQALYSNFVIDLRNAIGGTKSITIGGIVLDDPLRVSISAANALNFIEFDSYYAVQPNIAAAFGGEMNYLQAFVTKWASYPRTKLLFGIPTYLLDGSGNSWGAYVDVIDQVGFNPNQNSGVIVNPDSGVSGMAYWNGATSVHNKAIWVQNQGLGGLSFFTIGSDLEPTDSRSLIYAVGSTTPPPPNDGSLNIISRPSQANVTINGVPNGLTDEIVIAPPGSYTVVISKTGYTSITRIVTVYSDQETEINVDLVLIPPPPGEGTLSITSNPEGADIVISGVGYGLTNKSISLSPGTYSVVLSKLNYEPYSEVKDVIDGEVSSINANLVPLQTPSPTSSLVPVGIVMGFLLLGTVIKGR